jgi:hypothetical protein
VTYNLYASLNEGTAASNTLMRGGVAKLALGFPLGIVVLAYIFDSKANMDPDVENGIVNVARHSCRHLLNQLLPIVDPPPPLILATAVEVLVLSLCSRSQVQHAVLEHDGGVATVAYPPFVEWPGHRGYGHTVVVEDWSRDGIAWRASGAKRQPKRRTRPKQPTSAASDGFFYQCMLAVVARN